MMMTVVIPIPNEFAPPGVVNLTISGYPYRFPPSLQRASSGVAQQVKSLILAWRAGGESGSHVSVGVFVSVFPLPSHV